MPSRLSIVVPGPEEEQCRDPPRFPFRVHFASLHSPITSDRISKWRLGLYREIDIGIPDSEHPQTLRNQLFGTWWLDPSYASSDSWTNGGSDNEDSSMSPDQRGETDCRPDEGKCRLILRFKASRIADHVGSDNSVNELGPVPPPPFAEADMAFQSIPSPFPPRTLCLGSIHSLGSDDLLRAAEPERYTNTSSSTVFHTYLQGMFELNPRAYRYQIHPVRSSLVSVRYWFEVSCIVETATGNRAPFQTLCRVEVMLIKLRN